MLKYIRGGSKDAGATEAGEELALGEGGDGRVEEVVLAGVEHDSAVDRADAPMVVEHDEWAVAGAGGWGEQEDGEEGKGSGHSGW